MLEKLKSLRGHPRVSQLTDVRNIGLYVFAILVLLVSYNGVQVIQTNYELQKKISRLQQENEIIKLQNSNQELTNKYYETSEYLELAARKQYGKAAPGETVLLMPRDVALKYAHKVEEPKSTLATENTQPEPFYTKNLHDWWQFFFRPSTAK